MKSGCSFRIMSLEVRGSCSVVTVTECGSPGAREVPPSDKTCSGIAAQTSVANG